MVPVTFIRRPRKDGDLGRSYASASRHAVVVSARYRVAGCARILPDACLRLSHLTAFTTTGIALMDRSSGSSLPSHAVVSLSRPPLRRNAFPIVLSAPLHSVGYLSRGQDLIIVVSGIEPESSRPAVLAIFHLALIIANSPQLWIVLINR